MNRAAISRTLVLGLTFLLLQGSHATALPGAGPSASTWATCLGAPSRVCVLEQALRDTAGIVDELSRTHMLVIIGKALARASTLDEALRVARSIKFERIRAIATAEIGEAQAELGLSAYADDTLAEALQTAQTMLAGLPTNARPNALGAVARAEARSDKIEKALEIARSIEDEQERGFALSFIALTQAKGGKYPAALEIARCIEDMQQRASVIEHIAEQQARAGSISDALESLRAIGIEHERNLLIGSIVEIEARAGRVEEGMHLARSIGNEPTRASAFLAIAKAQAGLAADTTVALDLAEQAARRIKSDQYRTRALAAIAQVQAQLSRPSEALATARSITDAGERGRALVAIAEEQIKARQIIEAGHTLELALQSASLMETPVDIGRLVRTPLLIAIVNAQIKAGLTKDAENTLERIVGGASPGRLAVNHATELYFAEPCVWQNEQAKSDDTRSVFILDRSTMVVYSTTADVAFRSCGISHFAESLAQAGLKEEAVNLFGQALQMAQLSGNEWIRGEALRFIVKAEVRSGLVNSSVDALAQALRGAYSIAYAGHRVEALYTIAMALPI